MSNWCAVPFETLYLEPSRNGVNRPRRVRGSGYKMINMGELFTYGRIKNPSMELVPLNEEEIQKYGVLEGDLLFARQSLVASGAGKCSIALYVPEVTTFEGHLIRVRLDQSKAAPLFYYYYFSSPIGMGNVQSLVMQVAAAGIRGSELAKLPIPYPPLPTQRKIAAVLSAYDDLIENNTRRIQILEEMAQAIYREWFVHFRFPGYENVRMVDSGTELGLVPEGWDVEQIGEVIEVLGGGTPSTKVPEYWDNGHINWFTPKDLTAAGTMFMSESPRKITEIGLQKSSAKMFPPYSVMMTSRATLGVTALNTQPACTNQGFITCVPDERLSAYYIYFWIDENLEKIIAVASGATFKEITKGTFRKLPIILPDPVTKQKFVETLAPIGSLIENIQTEIANLRTSRDLLLPKLVSGEVDVSGLEIGGGTIHE